MSLRSVPGRRRAAGRRRRGVKRAASPFPDARTPPAVRAAATAQLELSARLAMWFGPRPRGLSVGLLHHDHQHGSHAGHQHTAVEFRTAFALGILLNGGFVLIEATFGFLANSVALIADAGHNLSDLLG